jgi:hypothetical protein
MGFLYFFVGKFCPPGLGSGSSRPKSRQIQADPDPRHWLQRSPTAAGVPTVGDTSAVLAVAWDVSSVLLLVDS